MNRRGLPAAPFSIAEQWERRIGPYPMGMYGKYRDAWHLMVGPVATGDGKGTVGSNSELKVPGNDNEFSQPLKLDR